MRFAVSAAALAAFISTVLAQTADFDPITKPVKDEDVPAGSTYDITWDLTPKYTGSVTLSLLGGKTPGTLVALGSIGTADNGDGKFAWDVDASLGDDATYGIQITLDSDKTIFQYSFPFHITGGSGGSDNSSTSASGTATYTISSVPSSKSTDVPTYPTTKPSGNYSTTAGPHKTTLTTTSGPTGTGTGGSGTVPTAGAGALVAGPLAVLGGLAMAALAL